jgi:hypothetical protein
MPLLTFAFSCLVTKTFNSRYVLVAAIGTPLFTTVALGTFPWFRKYASGCAVLIVLFSAADDYNHRSISSSLHTRNPPLIESATENYPVVLSNPDRLFEYLESASPRVKQRLTYLVLPRGSAIPDSSGQHQIQRWKEINKSLPCSTFSGSLPIILACISSREITTR